MNSETLKLGWRKWRFDQIATSVNERIDNPSESGLEYYVGLEHIDPDSLKLRRWGSPTDVEATKLIFRKGDIIFGRRRVYQRKVAVADFDGICSAHALVLKANPEVVLPEFLPFFMQSDLFMERAKSISVGSLSPTINWKTLSNEEFLLPPLKEQTKIAKVLSSLEERNASLQDLRTYTQNLLLSLRESLIGKYLRDRLAVNKYSIDWKIEPLKKVADITMGFAFKSADFCDEGIQLLRMGNVRDGELDLDNKSVFLPYEYADKYDCFLIKPGDIVISMTGTTGKTDYGYAALVDEAKPPLLLNQRVSKISPKEGIDPKFLSQVMRTRGFLEQVYRAASGSKQANLSIKQLEKIDIPYPCMDQQRNILNKIGEMEKALQSEDIQFCQGLIFKKHFVERNFCFK